MHYSPMARRKVQEKSLFPLGTKTTATSIVDTPIQVESYTPQTSLTFVPDQSHM